MTASCKDRPKFNCYIGPWISKSGAVLAKEGICSSRATFTPDAVEAKVWFGVGEDRASCTLRCGKTKTGSPL